MTTVYIISAPSGSGKSTLVDKAREIVPGLEFSISYTTRPPRGTEQNGREYFFVPRSEFEEMVRKDEFLEHADVFGHCYGTAKRFLHQAEKSGNDLLLDIDVQGAEQIKRKLPGSGEHFHYAAGSQGFGGAPPKTQSGCGSRDPAPVGHGQW